MTDEQRDALLLELRDGARKQDALLLELAASMSRMEATQSEHSEKLEALAGLPEKVDRILKIVQGQATARVQTDRLVSSLRADVDELKAAAG